MAIKASASAPHPAGFTGIRVVRCWTKELTQRTGSVKGAPETTSGAGARAWCGQGPRQILTSRARIFCILTSATRCARAAHFAAHTLHHCLLRTYAARTYHTQHAPLRTAHLTACRCRTCHACAHARLLPHAARALITNWIKTSVGIGRTWIRMGS